jgi:hypothetical protein
MIFTSLRGELLCLPGNRDAYSITGKNCDKKENKNKCTSDTADELHQ